MTREEIIEHMKVMANHAAMDDAMLYVMTVKDLEVVKEAAEVLKAQEPVEPIRKVIGYGWRYFCGKCGNSIVAGQNFCQKCGQAVKWK